MSEMETIPGSLAHPGHSEVKIMSGTHTAVINKWTMAERAELKPRLAKLLNKVGVLQSGGNVSSVAELFTEAEDELVEVCRVSAKLPEGVAFDDLLWEDLPNLVQAVWETNIMTAEGGGIAGKLGSLVMPFITAAAQASAQAKTPAKANNTASSPPPSHSTQKLQGSPS